MKLAFSTIACPGYTWTEIYPMASDLGYDGIEIRGLGDDIYAMRARPFSEGELPNTISKLASLGLEISCFSSACELYEKDKREANVEEVTQYIELASKMGAPFVRIMAVGKPNPDGGVDDDFVIDVCRELATVAESKQVTLVLETAADYADTKRLRKVLDAIDSPAVQALWDLHHPYRYYGESPAETVANLGHYIKYCHVKDSIMDGDRIRYRLMGEGDLPLYEMFDALDAINYEGYMTLEWVKRWAKSIAIEDAGIIFPQYKNFMDDYSSEKLQTSLSGEGRYVWPKEHLIDLTFPEVLDRMCKEFPSQYAFRYTECDYTRTYPEFRDDVDRYGRALIAMGVQPGDHVAIWATNVPQWYLTFWASIKIGAVLVTVNTGYKVHEAEYLLRQSDTHTLVMIDGYKETDYVGIMNELCPELADSEPGELHSKRLPVLRNVITVDGPHPGCYSWEEALAKADEVDVAEVYARARTIDKNDVCNMQYTSGTTGFPKGVMLTHYNVVNNGKAIGDCMDLSTADRMMIQVPMFHCFGMVLAMTASMTHGTTMSPIPYFSPRRSLNCINREKITCFHGVPTMFIAMMNTDTFESTDFSHMRTGIMAGSPCPIEKMKEVIDRMHMSEICITYGETEASPATTMSKTTDTIEQRVHTVGLPIYGVECKIIDPETGEELGDNQPGEFCSRGYNTMRGYYKMPEATAAVIDEDGWLHSGDLLLRQPDGYFRVTGRLKDMIIRGGENIYPKEIEDFLYTHPKVSDVQVIGVPDKQYGEQVMAEIILKDGVECTEEEIRDFCRASIAKEKVPHYVRFVDGFPMNEAGKIQKFKMRDEAVEYLSLQEADNVETA